MIAAIQQGYYLRALNPSDIEVLIGLAKELSQQQAPSLDVEQFIIDISSSETDHELTRQVSLARQLSQQGFPSLVLEHEGIRQQIAIDYSEYRLTLADIINKVT